MANKEKGWVKIYRDLNDIVRKDTDYFSIFIYILLEARHKGSTVEFGGEQIFVDRGELITGRNKIVEYFNPNNNKTKLNSSKVQRVLKRLENEHIIEQRTTPFGRLIKVVNYDYYQKSEQPNEQQVNNHRTTKAEKVNTIQECNKELKELKNTNIYKEKEIKEKEKNIELENLTDFDKAFIEFKKHRKQLKAPMTELAETKLLNKLDKLAKTDKEKIDILEQSIVNGWKGVFALQGKKSNYKNHNKTDVEIDWLKNYIEEGG